MSANERDPRIEPKPGDVLLRGHERRQVTQAIGTIVHFKHTLRNEPSMAICENLPLWHTWATNAEIVRRGE